MAETEPTVYIVCAKIHEYFVPHPYVGNASNTAANTIEFACFSLIKI